MRGFDLCLKRVIPLCELLVFGSFCWGFRALFFRESL